MNDTTIDLVAVLLRLALGPMLVAHGYNKIYGAGGLAGTTRWFEGLGLRPAWLHARVAAANEILAGVLMTVGALTALSAAAFVGLMLVATVTDHRGKGYFVFKGGAEYTTMVAVVAVAVAGLGPGAWSIDHLLGIGTSGPGWAAAALGLGVVAATGLVLACYRPVPVAAPR